MVTIWRRALLIVAVRSFALPFAASGQTVPTRTLEAANARAPEGMTGVTSVRELVDGSVLVADGRENRLYHVSWSTNAVQVIGRVGQGPGEYTKPGWLYPLGPDTTLLTDQFAHRWFVLAGTRIVRTIVPSEPGPLALGPWLDGGDRFGNVLAAVPIDREPRDVPSAADSLGYLLMRRALAAEPAVDTVARVRGRSACAFSGLNLGGRSTAARAPRCQPAAYQTEDNGLLFSDGWVAIVRATPYRVSWRTPQGRWIEGAEIDVVRIRITEREKCFYVRRPRDRNGDCDPARVAAYTWPDQLPPFLHNRASSIVGDGSRTLQAAPDGSLLIRRTTGATATQTVYDVVDRRGVLTAHVTMPLNQVIVGSGGKAVYTITVDELGLQWLQRHDWL